MSTATFNSRTYTIPGTSRKVYLKYIKCNHRDITFRSINSSVKDSGYCGINGTFFRGTNLAGIAIDRGTQVKNYGTINRDPKCGYAHSYECGTYFVLEESVTTNTFVGTDVIDIYDGHNYNGIVLSQGKTRFAIGGTSLFPAQSIANESTYLQLISSEDAPAETARRPRTAIVYIGGDYTGLNTILLTVHGATSGGTTNHKETTDDGVTLWELRNMINAIFAPLMPGSPSAVTHAIALDGGSSTQIAYKTSSGVYKSFQVTGNRTVYSMLSVSMD